MNRRRLQLRLVGRRAWDLTAPEVTRTVSDDDTDEDLIALAVAMAGRALLTGEDEDAAVELIELAGELFDMQEDT